MSAADDKSYLVTRAKTEAVSWVRETSKGIATAAAMVLFGMVLVQLGLAREGQGFQFSAFAPLEFWQSFRGLVITWSEFNEWVLLATGLVLAAVTGVVFMRWRSKRAAALEPETADDAPRLKRLEARLASLKSVGMFALLTALTIGAYLYQQYLWRVVLPIDEGNIGVAFSRQVGGSVASDQLADFLRQRGHEGAVQMRELPVRFDARDTEKAREMAQRIGADAVVIYRPPGAVDDADAALGDLDAEFAAETTGDDTIVTYIVFADPSVGVEIPVPQRSAEGEIEGVEFREKEGLETPRLEAADLGALMEATAGILMYNEDRMLPAIAHLRNSVGDGTAASDALINFYLGNAYSLIDQDANAAKHLETTTKLLEGAGQELGLQDRLLLVDAYAAAARIEFYDGNVEEADALLDKAIALREPIDKDQSALQDPTNYRRFHEAYADVYLQLMDVSTRLNDKDAAALWRSRAQEEGDALTARGGDRKSTLTSIYVDYRTGSCADAYQASQALRAEDPDDAAVHRILMRIAYLRDGAFTGLESKAQLDRVLELRPDNLADLQSEMLYWSLRKNIEDPAYVAQEREVAERILELDPSNAEAIAQIVRSAELSIGGDLFDATAVIRPTGHPPTFARLQAERQRDPALLRALSERLDAVRPYVVRWAEEIEPESLEPLVYRANLSATLALWYYNYGYVTVLQDPEFRPDADVLAKFPEVFRAAVEDAEDGLAADREPDPRADLQLYNILTELWTQRYFTFQEDGPQAQADAAENLAEASAAALAIVEDTLGKSSGDVDLASSTYIGLVSAYAALRSHYTNVGEPEAVRHYERLLDDALAAFSELATVSVEEFRDEEAFLTRRVCPEARLKTRANGLLTSDPDRARALLTEYAAAFPADPEALIDLGWAQYLLDDLDAARQTTQRAAEQVPDHPVPAANLATIALAAGDETAAANNLETMITNLAGHPPSLRLRELGFVAADLLEVAREREPARAGVAAAVTRLQTFVDALAPADRQRNGAELVIVLNNLAAAAAWSGDHAAARALLTEALELGGDLAFAHANLAFVAVAEDDPDTARLEVDRAATAARTYLVDEWGQRLQGAERAERVALAQRELTGVADALDTLAQQQPDLAGSAGEVGALLRRAAQAVR